ncbi:trichohyalin-like [Anguilla anguilla]|uniref:trichohyalin-like n=1 Tax=Anguilla anguilla TaxID=7936 RepID=UPI0015B05409|nr:trichohyalin-like [Anguilla anguilla]
MESSESLPEYLPGTTTTLHKKNQSLNGRGEATNSENNMEEEEDEKDSEKKTNDEATDFVNNGVERPISPVSSVLSMQTSHSNHHDHPNLRTQPMESRVRGSVSPVSSVLSMQTSLTSLHDPPNFRTQPMESRYQPCDVCSDGRVRAVKSCLTCSALYCEVHIRDHYTEFELQEHKLVDITDNLYCQQEEAKHFSVSVETEQGETQSSVTDAQALRQNSWKQEWKTGRRPARKSATGNTVLGKREFNGGFSPVSGTSECEAHSAEAGEERRMEETERKIGEEEKIKRRKLERYINAEEESLQPRPESSGGHLPSPESSRGCLLWTVEFPSTLQCPRPHPDQYRHRRPRPRPRLPSLPDSILQDLSPDPDQDLSPDPDQDWSPHPDQYPSSEMERVQREQAERRNREKRMEALRRVQMSAIKMRYKVQKSFLKKFFKLPDPGMLNLQDAENMLEESEKEIKAWQEMQMENLERKIRAEMEELERKIREEERERRQELEKSLRAEMEELERKIREEERERRQELEQSLRAEMEKWREELERKIRKE